EQVYLTGLYSTPNHSLTLFGATVRSRQFSGLGRWRCIGIDSVIQDRDTLASDKASWMLG
ncbi:hypothetical protein JMJ77_0002910, partial [Colletotrichum scovillei]